MTQANVSQAGDPDAIPRLLAQHIVNNSVQNGSVTVDNLTDAISEITPETQTTGPALLQITLNDPYHAILRSGICSRGTDGFLQPIDVNFPEGTPVWWRLAMVDLQESDPSQPNLILTFQHRTVAYLLRCNGPLGWPKNHVGTTRSQFIKFLLDKMPSELPKNLIGPTGPKGLGAPGDFTFVCPDLNLVQPVASSNAASTEVVTAASAAAQQAGINKLPGLTAATHLTVKGVSANATQRGIADTLLGVGVGLNAPTNALVAVIYAAIWESGLTPNPGGGGTVGGYDYVGPLSGRNDRFSYTDTTGEANAFFDGGQGYGGGAGKGAIYYAKQGLSAVQIAIECEGGGGTTNYYAKESGYPGDAAATKEAEAFVLAYNGGTTGTSFAAQSDIASLERGTTDNEFEDSLTCIQRLASEVNWSFFSSVQPSPGVWGNYLYYMDGTTLVAQRPSLYVSLSSAGDFWIAQDPDTGKFLTGNGDGMVNSPNGTCDNTAFQVYEATDLAAASGGKAGSAKTTKVTRVQQPQTPTELMFNLVLGQAGALQYNGGDVFVLRSAGTFDGRWIVEDVTHNVLTDEFAQITLGPPEFAYPEPQADTIAITTANGQTVNVATGTTKTVQQTEFDTTIATGALSGAADAARKALAIQQKSHSYNYQELRPMPPALFPPPSIPIDCSTFATLCYKAAGLPDPNGPNFNYNGYGNTDDMIDNSFKISKGTALPGDLCFFGGGSGAAGTSHVNVYVGNGQSISMGEEGDPSIGKSEDMGPGAGLFLGWYRSNRIGQISSKSPVNLQQPAAVATNGIQNVHGGLLNNGTSAPQTPAQAAFTRPGGIFANPFGK